MYKGNKLFNHISKASQNQFMDPFPWVNALKGYPIEHDIIINTVNSIRKHSLKFQHTETDKQVGDTIYKAIQSLDARRYTVTVKEVFEQLSDKYKQSFSLPMLEYALNKFKKVNTREALEVVRFVDLRPELPVAGFTDKLNGELTQSPPVILHITAGNIPFVPLQTVINALFIGSGSIIKLPSSVESIILFDLFYKALPKRYQKLIQWVNWKGDDKQFEKSNVLGRFMKIVDHTVLFGTQKTLETLQQIHLKETGGLAPLTIYNPRISFSIIPKFRLNHGGAEICSKLADDFLLFNQQGCLSTQTCFVGVTNHNERVGFISDLRQAIFNLSQVPGNANVLKLPNSSRGFNLRHKNYADTVAISSTFYRSEVMNEDGFTIEMMHEKDIAIASDLQAPQPRWLKVVFIDSRSVEGVVMRACRAIKLLGPPNILRNILQSVSIEETWCSLGPKESLIARKMLSQVGFNRICKLGDAQFPPPSWRQDGKPLLSPWMQYTQSEIYP